MKRKLPLPLLLLSFTIPACDLGPEDPADDEVTAEDADDDDDDEHEGHEDEGDDAASEAEDPDVLAEIAVDSSDAVSGESALVATVSTAASEAAEAGADDDEALAEAAASELSVSTICAYGGTATATWDGGNEVTYSFLACSSHCGMHRATGEVNVTYSLLEGGGIGVDIYAEDFRIDGTRSDLDVSAEYRQEGAVAELSIDTEASMKGLFGWELTRSGSYDARFDAASVCIEHDGAWTTTFNELSLSTTLSDYRRCALECPEAGSRVAIETQPSGFMFEAEFATDTRLDWEMSNGLAGSLELPGCE